MEGWYERRLFNPLMDLALGQPKFQRLREQLLATVHDAPLEIGPGTGLNLPHYPARVRSMRVLAREAELDRRLLERAARRDLAVAHLRGDAARIPLPDASVDALVCTFVLCSVRAPRECLREFARVLRSGGHLYLLEHVRSPRRIELAVQRALTPLQRVVACGCELDRDLCADVESSSFDTRGLMCANSSALPFPASEVLAGIALRR
ncbi:MAG: class I SAM-dependent methyltransferase [Planctomycetes bacterium]|nr:class I SAM-dependent methyltransferase [Planctomycetota bacterium]